MSRITCGAELKGGGHKIKGIFLYASLNHKIFGGSRKAAPEYLQPLMIRGSIIWCWGQMERGFW